MRLAVTDRCNLRCFYCMPHERMQYLPKKEILTFEEMERLCLLLADMGISKIRLTGGEPFVRNDLMKFIRRLVVMPGIKDVHLTTNGVLTAPYIPELKELGISSVNLSLDSMNRARFLEITRRDDFEVVYKTLNLLLENEIPVKINAVVMEDKNIEDIMPLVELARNNAVQIRFIEEMPFNGKGTSAPVLHWTHQKIRAYINDHFELHPLDKEAFSTSSNYRINGFQGTIGIIAAFSRTFCGTCNRIRITAQGDLKTCLYGDPVLNLKQMMRRGDSDGKIREYLLQAFSQRDKDGFEAEQKKSNPLYESMSTIGG